MTYWRARVERPDGNGGWTVVGVFGTPDAPSAGIGRHLHGATALDAVQLLLRHVWPVNLSELNDRADPEKWRDKRAAQTGVADHRIVVDVPEANRWSLQGKALPDPQTFSVAELRLAEVRAEVAELAAAKVKLKELVEQVRRARSDVQYRKYRVERTMEEATCAGVAEADVAKAGRVPRRPRRAPVPEGHHSTRNTEIV